MPLFKTEIPLSSFRSERRWLINKDYLPIVVAMISSLLWTLYSRFMCSIVQKYSKGHPANHTSFFHCHKGQRILWPLTEAAQPRKRIYLNLINLNRSIIFRSSFLCPLPSWHVHFKRTLTSKYTISKTSWTLFKFLLSGASYHLLQTAE